MHSPAWGLSVRTLSQASVKLACFQSHLPPHEQREPRRIAFSHCKKARLNCRGWHLRVIPAGCELRPVPGFRCPDKSDPN